ncbi:ankyrin repeat domain-containing protein [Fusarium oxysporum f. sp. albedinis]|nr:ankyrin repeat domain-containing protein [Fusarium oxysporum f. sp. albedinis]
MGDFQLTMDKFRQIPDYFISRGEEICDKLNLTSEPDIGLAAMKDDMVNMSSGSSLSCWLTRTPMLIAQVEEYGTALQEAASEGHEYIVKLLLDNGADVNAQGGHFGTALQEVAFRGHEHIVKLLLENGADAKAQGGEYGTALQAAAFKGHEHIVKLLLKSGV